MPNNEVIIRAIILRIQDERIKQGISQNELAKASGIKQAQVSRLEAGKTKDPSLSTLLSLMGALGLAWEQLIDEQLIRQEDVSKLMFHPGETNGPAILDFEVKRIVYEESVAIVEGVDGGRASVLKFTTARNELSPTQLEQCNYILMKLLDDFRGKISCIQRVEEDTAITYIALESPLDETNRALMLRVQKPTSDIASWAAVGAETNRSLMLRVQDWHKQFTDQGLQNCSVLRKDELQALIEQGVSTSQPVTSCYAVHFFPHAMQDGAFWSILEAVPGLTMNFSSRMADQASVIRSLETQVVDLEYKLSKAKYKGLVTNFQEKRRLEDLQELLVSMKNAITKLFNTTVVFYLQADTLKELQLREEQLLAATIQFRLEKLVNYNQSYKLPVHRTHSQMLWVYSPWGFLSPGDNGEGRQTRMAPRK